jgi:3-oxoacyl-[acyl-carrier protein] reductase
VKLKNKNVLVTGGSRGIGRAICLELASEGARVAFTYLAQSEKANSLKSQLLELGVECKAFKSDVRDRENIKIIFQNLENSWGSLDILVNNAGINKPTDFHDITDDDWDEILSVNLKGPFIVSQEALDLLKKSGNSSIVNIGSISGQYGGPRTAHYAASKAGLISLSQLLARYGSEFGIRCNTISAGLISTDMGAEGLKSKSVSKAAEAIMLKRLGTVEEIAKSVVFLASDDSSYVTAQTINVNGGLYF